MSLARLTLSTDAGAWGVDHARRRSVDLQVSTPAIDLGFRLLQ